MNLPVCVCVRVYTVYYQQKCRSSKVKLMGSPAGRLVDCGGVAYGHWSCCPFGLKACSFQNQLSMGKVSKKCVTNAWAKINKNHVCQEFPSGDTPLTAIFDPKSQANSKPLSVKQIPSKKWPSTHWLRGKLIGKHGFDPPKQQSFPNFHHQPAHSAPLTFSSLALYAFLLEMELSWLPGPNRTQSSQQRLGRRTPSWWRTRWCPLRRLRKLSGHLRQMVNTKRDVWFTAHAQWYTRIGTKVKTRKTQRFGRLGWFWVVWGRNDEFKGSMLVITAK